MRLVPIWVLFLHVSLAFAAQLPPVIDRMIARRDVDKARLSLLIQNVDCKTPLVSLDPEVPRTPASLVKLLTTAAALIRMGADYRWPTRFYVARFPDDDGVLRGDLYVAGGGDPFLVEERLTAMLINLREKGIRHISGDIVLDTSLYHLSPGERDRGSFDGHPWSPYNAVPSPLMVNFRTVKIHLLPQGKRRVRVTLWPHIVNWKIDNRLQVSAASCSRHYSPQATIERDARNQVVVTLQGSYSTACGRRELTVAFGAPGEQFYHLFRDLWYQLGGTLSGKVRLARIPSSAKLFYTGLSLPLHEQIRKINRISNNVMTRQLMLTLGVSRYGAPGSLEKGRKAVFAILRAFGVPLRGAVIDNGSGLSRSARLSARNLGTLLGRMYHSGYAGTFLNSLAVAGESGTLKHRFRGRKLAGKVIGKTGTLEEVHAFAGYVMARSGRVYLVVMIGNGGTALASRSLQDDLLRWVYRQ